jgi:hypothetical protein
MNKIVCKKFINQLDSFGVKLAFLLDFLKERNVRLRVAKE